MKTPVQTPPNINDRNERLKAALQANIARRKTQVRARQADKPEPGPAPAPEAEQEE